MSEEQYQNLRHLLGGYLHQDWPHEFSTPDDAVAAFTAREPQDSVRATCNELREIIPVLAQMQDPERFLCDVLWCYYSPGTDGLTVADWLERVRKKLNCVETSVSEERGRKRGI